MSPTTPPSADQPTTSRSTAKVPSRLAGWRRLAWDWQEIGWLALLIPIAVFVSEIANTRERAGQSPLSWFADLAQLAAAVAVASLLAWLLKRALIGDLTDGEINAARHMYARARHAVTDRATCLRLTPSGASPVTSSWCSHD